MHAQTANWNAAANAAAGAGVVTGISDGKTTGTSYGAQVEIWFRQSQVPRKIEDDSHEIRAAGHHQ